MRAKFNMRITCKNIKIHQQMKEKGEICGNLCNPWDIKKSHRLHRFTQIHDCLLDYG